MTTPEATYTRDGARFAVQLDGVTIARYGKEVDAVELVDLFTAWPGVATETLRIAQGWRAAPGLAETARECRAEQVGGVA